MKGSAVPESVRNGGFLDVKGQNSIREFVRYVLTILSCTLPLTTAAVSLN